jgi:tRNA pseudouridine55 synthase
MDKAPGPTSHDVVAMVRRALGMRRVGHGGTLDPFASGVLPILIGRATRLAPFLQDLPKQYEGVLRLGITTDTDDAEGAVVREEGDWRQVDQTMLAAAMQALTGRLEQIPPAYSAKKVSGVPAHRLARRGRSVALAPRPVTVMRFECTARTGPDVGFTADVGSGTYIRALARDLGQRLGCGAHLRSLRRTAVGPWTVAQATPIEPWPDRLPVQPALAAVVHLRHRILASDEAEAVAHGRPITRVDRGADGPVALLADGALLAVGVSEGEGVHPQVVLAG